MVKKWLMADRLSGPTIGIDLPSFRHTPLFSLENQGPVRSSAAGSAIAACMGQIGCL
ncbi:MAG: hypothetical protein WA948_09005 [Pontixanthobacter sp.]